MHGKWKWCAVKHLAHATAYILHTQANYYTLENSRTAPKASHDSEICKHKHKNWNIVKYIFLQTFSMACGIFPGLPSIWASAAIFYSSEIFVQKNFHCIFRENAQFGRAIHEKLVDGQAIICDWSQWNHNKLLSANTTQSRTNTINWIDSIWRKFA